MRWLLVPLFALAACYPTAAAQTDREKCDAAGWQVLSTGDVMPSNWGYSCPGDAGEHEAFANVTSTGNYVVIGYPAVDDNDGGIWLRYIIAHETCHAREYEGLEPGNWADENLTDSCAARFGFPRP